jgi:hypothetical protein
VTHGRDEMFRFSIAKMMAIVGLISLNFGAARLLFAHNPYLLTGVVLIGLSLQVGLFRLIRSRHHVRVFWVGFVAFGSMAMVSFLWGVVFCPSSTGIMINGRKYYPPMSPGSTMSTVWGYYYEFATCTLKPLPYSDQILGVGGEMPVVTIVVVCYLPQLLIAAFGGLLTRSVIRRWRKGNWW